MSGEGQHYLHFLFYFHYIFLIYILFLFTLYFYSHPLFIYLSIPQCCLLIFHPSFLFYVPFCFILILCSHSTLYGIYSIFILCCAFTFISSPMLFHWVLFSFTFIFITYLYLMFILIPIQIFIPTHPFLISHFIYPLFPYHFHLSI